MDQSKRTEKEKLDKSALKSAILAAISEELDMWLEKEGAINDGYEYEEELIKIARNINHILLSKSIGNVSSNRNKKKTPHVIRRP